MDYKTPLTTALLTGVILLPAAHTQAAHAEEIFEEVVVSATRYERPLSNIGSSISLISAEDMEKSQTVFVQDILQNIPGLSLNQNGSFGGVSSVRIRGASSSQTVILIDGVQVNDTSSPGGSYNFASLDPSGIERIEVLRGPQSILYGSDAIGGVINVITKSGAGDTGGSLFAEAGSYNTYRAGGNIAGSSDRLNFSLSASGITTDGISKADENDGNTEDDGYRHITLHGKIGGKISENLKLQMIGRYTDSRNEFDSFGPSDGDQVGFAEEFLVAGRGMFDFLDGALKNTLSVEYSTMDRRNESGGIETSAAKGSRFNLDYFGHYKVSENVDLSFGLQHEETRSKSVSPLKFNIDSIFSELSWQSGDGLTVTAGLRYDDHNQYGGTTTPRLTASYYFESSGSKIFANWGEGFKAPSIFQLTYICGFCGLTEPNSDLKPEQSSGWEVGFEQALMDDRVHVTATYFDQKITNMIDFDFSVGYGNIDNVRTKGVELSLDLRLTDTLSIGGNYTFTNATDRDSGNDLIRVPRNAAFAEIQWQATPAFGLALNMTYNGKESDTWTPGTDGWTRFDLKAAYNINNIVELYARVDNLFDREYQQVYGYGTPDRSFYAGIRGTF